MCWFSIKHSQGEEAIETDCESFIFAFGFIRCHPVPLQRWANWILNK